MAWQEGTAKNYQNKPINAVKSTRSAPSREAGSQTGAIWLYNIRGLGVCRVIVSLQRSRRGRLRIRPTARGRHAQKTDQEQRAFPARREAPAARRRIEFPLLGRGAHDLHQARPGRAHLRPRRQRLRRLPPRLRTGDPRLCRSPGRSGRARGHGGRRRLRAVDRAGVDRRGAHREDGAGGRTRAVLEFRHRGGHGGTAARARLYRQGRLRDSRGQLSRPVRCGHVVHAHGQVVAGRRSRGAPVQRGRAQSARAASRTSCRPTTPIGCEDVFKRHADRLGLPADRADHGQLLRHRRRAGIPAGSRAISATATASCC